MERIFPPAFFTIMVHLVVHLATEAKIAGPVCYRWMYPVERFLGTLKSFVRNRAKPEGSIAEGYLANECLTFCSRYLSGVETRFNRPVRNNDFAMELFGEHSMVNLGRPLGDKTTENIVAGKRKRVARKKLDEKSLKQAHRYVLFNLESVMQFRLEHLDVLKRQCRGRKWRPYDLDKAHGEQFCDWFRNRVARMEEDGTDEVSDEIKWLARGPNEQARYFNGFIVNGFRFHTKEHDRSLRTQNHGVVVQVDCASYASSRDTQPVNGKVFYYGSLKEIIQLNYSGHRKINLFKCDWININGGCEKDKFGITLVNFSHLCHTGLHLADDPFIFASQAKKVYYAKDYTRNGWMVVRHVKLRELYDMGEKPLLDLDGGASEDSFDQQLHRAGVNDEDVVVSIEELEKECLEEEEEFDS